MADLGFVFNIVWACVFAGVSVLGGFYAAKSMRLIFTHGELKQQRAIWLWILISGALFTLAGLGGMIHVIEDVNAFPDPPHLLFYGAFSVAYLALAFGTRRYYKHMSEIVESVERARSRR